MDITTKEKLSGIFPPCMTIFDENEEVDYDKIAKNIEQAELAEKTKTQVYALTIKALSDQSLPTISDQIIRGEN